MFGTSTSKIWFVIWGLGAIPHNFYIIHRHADIQEYVTHVRPFFSCPTVHLHQTKVCFIQKNLFFTWKQYNSSYKKYIVEKCRYIISFTINCVGYIQETFRNKTNKSLYTKRINQTKQLWLKMGIREGLALTSYIEWPT